MKDTFKPAYAKGFLWFLFSGTATLCAFLLPIHMLLMTAFPFVWPQLDSIYLRSYFFILFFAALYHGLYRTETILIDLGFGRYEKAIKISISLIFVLAVALDFFVFFVK